MMMTRGLSLWALAVAATILGLGGQPFGQAPNPSTNADLPLAVGGDVTHALSVTQADLKGMPRTTVTVSEEGREVKYEGGAGWRAAEARRSARWPRPLGPGGRVVRASERKGRLSRRVFTGGA